MDPDTALRKVRNLVDRWPGVVETQSWGHPNWKAGARLFASFDSYDGVASVCFKASPRVQATLATRSHFFLAPYAGHRGWICRTLEEPLDWLELSHLIEASFALVAPSAAPKPKVKLPKGPRLRAKRTRKRKRPDKA
jgi:predicted DNA-binding protein (MmcQ/YjbR family)